MTGQDWPVGTVAVATVRGVEGVRVIRCGGPGESGRNQVSFWWSPEYVLDHRLHNDSDVTDVRALPVIDPWEDSERLQDLYQQARANGQEGLSMHAALIDFQKPPRIPEPGLWGVVSTETVDGLTDYWTHGHAGWFSQENGETWQWEELIDPVLIRPGIEDES